MGGQMFWLQKHREDIVCAYRNIGDHVGRGQAKVKELVKDYFSDLYRAGFGIIVIGHTKLKTVVEKASISEEGYQTLTSNLPNTYATLLADIFDVIATGYIDKNIVDGRVESSIRKLQLRGDSFVEAGTRFANDSVPEYIVFDGDNDAKKLLDVLKEGMRNSASKPLSSDEFEKMAEKQKVEDDKKAKEFIENKVKEEDKVDKAGLLDEIKALATTTEARKKLTEYMKASNVSKVGDFNVEQLKEIREALAR